MTRRQIILTSGSLLLFLIIAVMLMTGKLSCNKPPKVVAPIDSTFYWKNRYEKEVASQRGYAQQFELVQRRIADSLALAFDTKARLIKEWIMAYTRTQADIPAVFESRQYDYAPPVIINNTECPPQVKRMRQAFHSPYYDAQVQLGDSSYLHLQGTDSITVLWKLVREGRLLNRRKLLQLDVSNANPDTRIIGLKSFRAGPIKPKRLGIGLQAGYEFDGKRFRPYWGLGVSYNLIRF